VELLDLHVGDANSTAKYEKELEDKIKRFEKANGDQSRLSMLSRPMPE